MAREGQPATREASVTPATHAEDPAATATAALPNAPLEAVELGGIYSYFWVGYDPGIWQVGENDFGLILINRDHPNCIVRENVGMGVHWPDITIQNDQVQVATYEVDLTQYIVRDEIVFKILPFNSENIFIAIDTGDEPEVCLAAARGLVEVSAENGFKPFP